MYSVMLCVIVTYEPCPMPPAIGIRVNCLLDSGRSAQRASDFKRMQLRGQGGSIDALASDSNELHFALKDY